jgi:hypothetical protein
MPSGVLGLTPKSLGGASIFQSALKDNAAIPSSVFVLDIQNTTGVSTIYFGGYGATRNESDFKWADATNNNYWAYKW